MKKAWLVKFKEMLTRLGARLSASQLDHLKASLNYMLVGRWMVSHGYSFPDRKSSREEVWKEILDRVGEGKVLYLEFGVASGTSMRFWAKNLTDPRAELHGFDSFEGLPESGGIWQKGQFDAGGKVPQIDDARVRFHKGWFDATLPAFDIPEHDVLIVNVDADLYSSTIFVLRELRPYFQRGTFLYFDEMNHVEHEPRAFDEFMKESGLRFDGLCADQTLAFVAFQCH